MRCTETWGWQRCGELEAVTDTRSTLSSGHPHPLKHPENLSWELGGIQRIWRCSGRFLRPPLIFGSLRSLFFWLNKALGCDEAH